MRGFIVMAMFVVSLAHAGWKDFEEVRELSLEANSIDTLSIEAGAGSMDVTGVAGLDRIKVTATIVVPDADQDKAARAMEKRMVLSLQEKGNEAELKAWFKNKFMGFGSDSYIVLDVNVPKGMAVEIDDGAGSIEVIDVEGDITIDDGSGSIDVENVASVKVDDGSGSVTIKGVAGDVTIVDGSGSISVNSVQGTVTIDDGSGGIRVSDVERDLVIVDDGSGGQSFTNIRGSVDLET